MTVGMMVHGRGWALALVAAGAAWGCATDTTPGEQAEVTSSTSSDDVGSTAVDESTTDPATTTGTATTMVDGTTTGESSSSSSETGDVDLGCRENDCLIQCFREVDYELRTGETCSCVQPALDPPPDYPSCNVPLLCTDQQNDYLCAVQALRYGLVGAVSWDSQVMDVGGWSSLVVVLAPQVAYGSERAFAEKQCCGFASQDDDSYLLPFELPLPDDPLWQQCLAATAEVYATDTDVEVFVPDCLRPTVLATSCLGEPVPCPRPPPPPAGPCEDTCPMAGDGVCDEALGTGLCPEGCDPLDCTCDANVEFQCDDVSANGPCPLGSDADCGSPK